MRRRFEARIELFVDEEVIKLNRREEDEGLEDEIIVEDMLRDLVNLVFEEVEVADVEELEMEYHE